MCGIAGIIDKKNTASVTSLAEQMTLAMESRGPDGNGVYAYDNIAIGHRRLSIIDVEGGAQPLSDNNGQYHITYNGELYNYKVLKKELEKEGVSFKTDSDTEVVLYAYIIWGKECVRKFRGMFAFGILNSEDKSLFLARDPFGIKPLCYYSSDLFFAFASELKVFRCLPSFDKSINFQALDMYLWLQYIPAPHTIFEKVNKVEPGFYMEVAGDGSILTNESYNQFGFQPEVGRSESDWLEELDTVLKKSVKAHLVADVPFGAFLSGGVDSSIIVSLMAQELSAPVKTFSIGFEEERYSELPFARKVAEKWNTEHHEEIVRFDSLEVLPELVKHYGEPFGDSSALPTYYLSKMASSHVPMVLSGDGADEAFAGYGSHVNWMKDISKPNWVNELPFLQQKMYPFLNKVASNKYPITWKAPTFGTWIQYVQYLNEDWRSKLWRPEYHSRLERDSSIVKDYFNEGQKYGGVNTVQYFDLKTYLPNDILTKVDVASMMNSLEVRTPFVDMEVWKLALSIPEEFNIKKVNNKNWEGKRLLKKWLEPHFDDSFIYRSKMGFGVPLKLWFAQDGKYRRELESVLLNPDAQIALFFDIVEIKKMLNSADAQHIWLLLFLEFWLIENK